MMISDEMVEKYKKGSKPEHIATQARSMNSSCYFETINQTETDLESKIFITIRNTQHLGLC
jgi:hypothetical protein